jgi:diguanylate cyclase (GGDEF)-like protein
MSRHVLLIDDDRLQFRVTQAQFDAFRHERFNLDWAETYEQGLAKLKGGGYAACLLDYQLGANDGLQLIHAARELELRTPIIFLTAATDDHIDTAALAAGALDYLVKAEITPRQLERSLRYAMKLGETLEALRQLATRDSLTGVPNRREFERILDHEVERARRFGHALAVIMVDVDHFKAINDAHGHPAGDAVLRDIARRLTEHVRTGDRVARVGGEEFGLILVQTDRAEALAVAENLCAAVQGDEVRVGDGPALAVTLSAGVASLPRDGANAAALIAAADKALYVAKSAGRNRVAAAGA